MPAFFNLETPPVIVPTSFSFPLVVDASSPLIQVGIPDHNGWKSMGVSKKQALEGLFASAEDAFRQLALKSSKIDAIFFCEGPGSTLGLRIACAFVKTIQWANHPDLRLYKYNALDMAHLICGMQASIQAPFRRGFRFVRQGEQAKGRKQILPEEEALAKFPASMHLPDPRKLNPSIPEDRTISYNLETQTQGLQDLLQVSEPCDIAAPYSPRPAEFKKWKHPSHANS